MNNKIIKYIPPGLLLAEEIKDIYDNNIDIYFLTNHGIIITNNNINKIIEIYENIFNYFTNLINNSYKLKNNFMYEYNTFLINKYFYLKKNKMIVVKYINYDINIIQNIKYCFPDLAIFIENIIIINHLNDLNKIFIENINIIILNNITYLCSDNLIKMYYLIELLDKYKILCEYSYDNLNMINDTKYLQNMEQEKFRKS
jgi:hypothetical protein